jgi:DNA-binding transcriptional regulator LsrR (DeoR family)
MGPIVDDPDAGDIRLCNESAMNERLYAAARAAGAVGEICYWCFDAEGKPVKTPYRSVGLGFEGMQDIARDGNRQVILICGGDKRRFAPLRAALKARLASVLVSDIWTARYLLDEN